MASEKNNPNGSPMYPPVFDSNYETTLLPSSSSSSSSRPNMYPSIDMKDLVENLFPDNINDDKPPANISNAPSAPPESTEEILLAVPGAILHLIDQQYSVELATGDLVILRLRQGDNTVAVLACVADEIQWPLTNDLAAVKLDSSHYFFSFSAPRDDDDSSSDEEEIDKKGKKEKQKKNKNKKESEKKNDALDVLNYGLTIASKGQEDLLKQLDEILEISSSFSVQKVEEKAVAQLGGSVPRELSPADLMSEKKKEVLEERCAAYWTTLAPNVEEYSGVAAKLIAAGSGQLIKGILWCGDITVDRLKLGNEVLKTRVTTGSKAEVSPETLKRIKRVKKVTKMTEKVALGVLSGVVKVSGFVTSSVANSRAGKKFFGLLPGEMILASLDGFSKICDAVEVAGKSVMSTSSTVTTGLVSHRYGEEAAKATTEGLDAAGHAVGTAWAVFKIRKALNPKSVLKPSSLAKTAAKSAAKSVAAEKIGKSSK